MLTKNFELCNGCGICAECFTRCQEDECLDKCAEVCPNNCLKKEE